MGDLGEYGTQERIQDLSLLAASGGYGAMPYEALLASVKAVAHDPEVFVTKDGVPTQIPQENREGFLVDMLMTPYYRHEVDNAFNEAIDSAMTHHATARVRQNESIKTQFGISDERWETMTPWERAYYEQEYNYQ